MIYPEILVLVVGLIVFLGVLGWNIVHDDPDEFDNLPDEESK